MTVPHARIVTRLSIPAMTPVHGIRAVFTALGGIAGVVSVEMSRGQAVVEHDRSVTETMLRAAVDLAGFDVAMVVRERAGLPLL